MVQEKIPRAWRQAKIIAVTKPGKDHSIAANCRPMPLLPMRFKAMERLFLHRISPTLDDTIVVEQAGFRHGRGTCDQVLALITFIENGFQRNQKTGVIFLDLAAAYARRHSLALGHSSKTFHNPSTMLSTRLRQTLTSSHWQKVPETRHQKNGLPLGSVLSPSLFNVYVNELPQTALTKFICADDIWLGA